MLRRVALKVIRRGQVSADNRRRFEREQKVQARLHQSNIVPIHASGAEDDIDYFAMQYVEGASLNHVVRALKDHEAVPPGSKTPSLAKLVESMVERKTPTMASLDASTKTEPGPKIAISRPHGEPARVGFTTEYYRSVAEALADAADALHVAHGQQIIHRDIKPSNLMVDRHGHCWILDFGLAAGLASDAASSSSHGNIEHTRGAGGTPQYMAPEHHRGFPDVRSDIWSLGATLYELLTLETAFTGDSNDEIRKSIESTTPRWPRTVNPGIPSDLDAICQRAMQKDADERYPTAKDFAEDLRRWLTGYSTTAHPGWSKLRPVRLWAIRNKGLGSDDLRIADRNRSRFRGNSTRPQIGRRRSSGIETRRSAAKDAGKAWTPTPFPRGRL